MEQFKDWVVKHKALAAGGGLALVIILYLWLRSGSSAAAGPDTSGVQAYYAAQAAGSNAAAAGQQSTDALAAATNQTNTAGQVALAQIKAQLDAITTQSNLTAYADYLAEANTAGTASSAPSSNANVVEGVLNSGHDAIAMTVNGFSTITDLVTGQSYYNSQQTPSNPGGDIHTAPAGVTGDMEFNPTSVLRPMYYAGPGTRPVTPTITTPTVTPPLTFAQFVAQNAPNTTTTH